MQNSSSAALTDCHIILWVSGIPGNSNCFQTEVCDCVCIKNLKRYLYCQRFPLHSWLYLDLYHLFSKCRLRGRSQL